VYQDIKKYLFTILILASIAIPAFAQQNTKTQKLAKLVTAFESVIYDYEDDSLYQQKRPQWDKQQLNLIFAPSVDSLDRPELESLVRLNKRQLRNDLGFDLNAGFLNNFEQTLLDSEGRFYRRRYTMGTRWDILGGGLLDNKLKARLLDYELERQKQLDEIIASKESVDIVYQRVLFVFNRAKQKEIKRYLLKLDQELLLLRNLSDLGYDVRELFRDLARKQLRYELQLDDFKEFEQKLDSAAYINDKSLLEYEPVLFSLAIDSIKNRAMASQYEPIDNLVKIEAEKNNEAFKRWRDISANLQFQYNYFDRLEEQSNNQFLNDREFFSLTGSIRVPLSIFTTNYKKAAQLTTARYREVLERDVQNRDNELVGQYREFENRKRGIYEIDGDIAVVTERIADEKNQFLVNKQNYNPALLLSHISNRQSLMIERLVALEDYYLTFYKIWKFVPNKTINEFTYIESDLGTTRSKALNSIGVYLWSKDLYGFSNSYIIQKIEEYAINKIALSVGELTSVNREKVHSLISELKSKDIQVSLLIGNNTIVNDTTFTKAEYWVKLAAGLSLNSIHLDIEPHTLQNWGTQKNKLKDNYLDLLAFVAKEAELYNLDVEVSIPHFYDDILDEINKHADYISVMVYNDLSIPSVNAKLIEEKRILTESKWGLSLKVLDFSSKEQIALFIKGIRNSLGNNPIYLQDFKDLDSLNK
jgi:hypothetical protein